MEADYPKQCIRCTLWKETNFKNRIDTIWGGQYIQNEEFILDVELSGNHLLKTGYGYGSGWYFLCAICYDATDQYDMSLTS